MRSAALVVTLILLAGCGWYLRSFQGPPGGTDEPLVGMRSYSYVNDGGAGMESITVKIIQSEQVRPWCWLEASGIDCTFPSEYLMTFAAMTEGGWRWLTPQSALEICNEALWSVPQAPADARRQCAFALVEMRWQEAIVTTPGRNE